MALPPRAGTVVLLGDIDLVGWLSATVGPQLEVVWAGSVEEALSADSGTVLLADVTNGPEVLDALRSRSWRPVVAIARRNAIPGVTAAAIARGAVAALREGAPADVARLTIEVGLVRAALAGHEAVADARERLAVAGEVAAAVAHEINNPLTFALTNVEHVRERLAGGGSEERRQLGEALAEACEGLQRAVSVARDLKLLVRASSRTTTFDAARAVRAAVSMVRAKIERVGALELDIADGALVRASEQRLCQVLVNLLVNASQAIPAGAPEANQVKVAVGRLGTRVWIEVEDTGSGIAPGDLKRVFDPFFSTKPEGEGTGLGLPLCRRFIEEMGGEIRLASELGRGTTIRVEIPTAQPVVSSAATLVPGLLTPAGILPRVLVVDDERLIGRAFKRALSPTYQVVHAASGGEALALLERGESFDVVLTDLHMPGMSGIELYGHIAQRWPQLTRRVAFLTGDVVSPELRRFFETTSRPRLLKPVGAVQMMEFISDLIGHDTVHL